MASKKKKWISLDFDSPKYETTEQLACKKIKRINKTVKLDAVFIDDEKKMGQFEYFKLLRPKSVEDLAVHQKKVQEVEAWIKDNVINCTTKQNVPMLLITGPTGSGKTSTVQMLCKSLDVDIQEWVNPSDQDYEIFKGPSQANRLLEFLNEATYPSLFNKKINNKKITLIEDFPNSLVNNPNEFDRILSTFVSNAKSVIVFISTEVNANGLTNIAKNLFTEDIRQKYNICNISFNAASNTQLKQALKRAQAVVQSNMNILKLPDPKVAEAIVASAMGDIRCAVNQYYIAALKGSDDLPMETTRTELKPGQKRKRAVESSKIKLMSKDEPLGLFHSLGRVLNPKRVPYGNSWRIQHDLSTLIDEFSSQPTTFNAFLHENYIKYFGDFDDLQKASEALSLAQTFLEKWSENRDTLIVALWISVLGLMVSNEHKVSKWNAIRGPVKIKPEFNNAMENRNLSVTDYCFYNRIKKCDKYHKFSYCNK